MYLLIMAMKKKKIFILFLLFIIYMFFQINVPKKKRKNNTVAVGIIAWSLSYGGIDRFISLFLNSMSEKTNYTIICLGTRKSRAKYKINDKVIFLAENGLPRRIPYFNKLIKDYNIKYLIYQRIDKYCANFLSKLNTKVIAIFHGLFFGNFYDDGSFKELRLFHLGKKISAVIGIAPYDYYIFDKHFNNSVQMPNFITFDENETDLAKLDNHEIVMINKINPIKNFPMGYRAFAEILKEVPDATLKIISKKKLAGPLKKLAKSLNIDKSVKYTGYLSNPTEELKKSSLLLFTSFIEGCPLSLSEGRGVGLPVVINELNYTYYSLEGITTCKADDYKDMAEKAIYILKNETYRKELGKISKEKLHKFSNKYTVERWVQLFDAIDNNKLGELSEKFKKIDGYDETKGKLVNEHILNLLKKRFPKKFDCIKLDDLLDETYLKNIKFCNK